MASCTSNSEYFVINQVIEEHEARMNINFNHDPVHRLPPEITAHILRFTVADFVPQKTKRGKSEVGALNLGAICRVWRTIAWTTPRLWCNLMLSLCSAPTWNKIDVVEQWLERSKPLPLAIRLYIEDDDEDIDDLQDADSDISRLVDFVIKFNWNSARWETLSLNLPNWLSVLVSPMRGNTSAIPLKTLQLILRQETRPNTRFSLGRSTPKPKPNHVITVGYRRLKYIGISWRNVTDATIDCLLLEDCALLLHLAPMLVNLCLRNIILKDTHPSVKTLQVHDHLRFLKLTPQAVCMYGSFRADPTFISAILDNFTLPSLEDLSIESSAAFLPLDSLKNLLGRSSCPLITLRIDGFQSEQQTVVDLLYVLPPSVKNIQLNVRQTYRTDHDLPLLFDYLSGNLPAQHETPSESELLPNLETFKYRVFDSDKTIIPWDRFPGLLRPFSGKTRPFKKLTIIERDCRIKPPPPIYTKGVKIEKCVIRDLVVTLIEDGVDLFLPCKVFPQDLLALLEE